MQYTIKQIRNLADTPYAFRDYDEKKFNEDDYKTVWEGATLTYENIYEFLEDIFCYFNATDDHYLPKDFRGHSLSVSDIVLVQDEDRPENNGLYYCNSFGYKKVR